MFGAIQVVTLATLGSFTGDRLAEALWAVSPILIVIPIGTRIARRLDQPTFGRVVLGLLAFAGLRLVLPAVGI